MKNKKDSLPLALRLGLGFSAVLSMMAIVTFSGVYKIDSVRKNLERVSLLSQEVTSAGIMRNSVQDMSISLRDSVLTDSQELFELAKGESKKQMGKYTDAKDDLKTTHEKLNLTSEEIAANIKINEMKAYAEPIIQQVLDLREKGKIDQAKELLVYEASTAMAMWWGSLSDFIEEREKQLDLSTAEANTESRELLWLIVIMSVAALIASIVIATIITKRLLGELGAEPSEVKAFAEAIGQGEFYRKDQIGMVNPSSIMQSLINMANQLRDTVISVRSSADSVATGSEQLLEGNSSILDRTGLQASAITETAAAMEELGSTVKQNTENSTHADSLAHKASLVAERGGSAMENVVRTMREINISTKEISEIVTVIDSIAFQTNLLALNASVEAARAGEQGRGFSVVASEVRGLAQRSATASQTIRSLITQNSERVEEGTALVESAGKTIKEIVESISSVSHIMTEISAASQEQSAGVDSIRRAMVQMDKATQTNALIVSQNQEASIHLKEQAIELQKTMQIFKLEEC